MSNDKEVPWYHPNTGVDVQAAHVSNNVFSIHLTGRVHPPENVSVTGGCFCIFVIPQIILPPTFPARWRRRRSGTNN